MSEEEFEEGLRCLQCFVNALRRYEGAGCSRAVNDAERFLARLRDERTR